MKGLYIPSQSPLHRLNPLIKLIAVFPLIVFLTMVTDPWTPLVLTLSNVAIVMGLGNIPPKRFLKSSIPMLLTTLSIAMFYPFLVGSRLTEGSPVLFKMGPLQVHEAGILFGVATALRLYAMYSVTLVFVMTTDSADFIRAMIQQWKLSDRFGYATLAVFRFIPDLRRELQTVQAAHRVRGMNVNRRKGQLFESVRRYMIPLLASAIRRAERTAYAMDARGFGAFGKRTFYRHYAFASCDWAFLAIYWLLTSGLIILVYQLGWMGNLSFLKLAN